jgi:hypothetical protein
MVLNKSEIKVLIAVIMFFILIIWFFPNLICFIDTGSFCPKDEYTTGSSGFFGDE